MIVDSVQFHQGVLQLQEQLSAAREEQWVRRLEVALSGSTSGEILAGLHYELRELRRSAVPRQRGLQSTLDDLLLYADATLGPSSWWPRSLLAPLLLRVKRRRAKQRP